MIKRCACLSVSAGGRVESVEAEPGKFKRITTYCRFYQSYPVRRSILCFGFMSYPPCPDLQRCLQNKAMRPKEVALEKLAEVEED